MLPSSKCAIKKSGMKLKDFCQLMAKNREGKGAGWARGSSVPQGATQAAASARRPRIGAPPAPIVVNLDSEATSRMESPGLGHGERRRRNSVGAGGGRRANGADRFFSVLYILLKKKEADVCNSLSGQDSSDGCTIHNMGIRRMISLNFLIGMAISAISTVITRSHQIDGS